MSLVLILWGQLLAWELEPCCCKKHQVGAESFIHVKNCSLKNPCVLRLEREAGPGTAMETGGGRGRCHHCWSQQTTPKPADKPSCTLGFFPNSKSPICEEEPRKGILRRETMQSVSAVTCLEDPPWPLLYSEGQSPGK